MWATLTTVRLPFLIPGRWICVDIGECFGFNFKIPARRRLFNSSFMLTWRKKTKAPHHWPLMKGIPRAMDSRHKGPVMRKAFPCYEVIMKWPDIKAFIGIINPFKLQCISILSAYHPCHDYAKLPLVTRITPMKWDKFYKCWCFGDKQQQIFTNHIIPNMYHTPNPHPVP